MRKKRLGLGFLLLAGSSLAQAQVQPQLKAASFSPHPLTARGGKVIVNVARKQDQAGGRKPDCSHLVHEVYTLAGYPYPYASSFDLYAGIGNFARVARPQPGDLVVWRGHVGIVVDPIEHSFYSSLRSGLRTDFFDAPQWKARGPVRFYRYVVAKPSNLVLAGNRSVKTPRKPELVNSGAVVEDSHENLLVSARPITKDPGVTIAAVPGPESPSTHEAFEIPSSILVAAAKEMPSQEEIASAISELDSATGDILREQNFSQIHRKVIIYDDLTLDRPKFKGKHGLVQARVESRVTVSTNRIERIHRQDSLRWDILRMSDGWRVLAPKDRICVPRDVAIRMLAARLALLTQEGDVLDKDSLHVKAQLARILSTLFD
jgi:hypothetical protein